MQYKLTNSLRHSIKNELYHSYLKKRIIALSLKYCCE